MEQIIYELQMRYGGDQDNDRGNSAHHYSLKPAAVTFLGTGTSHGVPMIACDCAVCRSTDPRDKRLRPSIFLDVPSYARILVDAGPDLRQQALTLV